MAISLGFRSQGLGGWVPGCFCRVQGSEFRSKVWAHALACLCVGYFEKRDETYLAHRPGFILHE